VEALKVSLRATEEPPHKADSKRHKPHMQGHPYTLYAANPRYQLVYSRTSGEPIHN
jgi:hypothetical protein